ncbi:histidine kinase [hydrothermal vent metagenome]|uniref:Histidine kinase n=1 Tax=hydrothermal vent metagenome TaxID=652676 RepID=A0A1W1BAI8_9ZZZZ
MKQINVDIDISDSLKNVPKLQEVFASVAHQWRRPLTQINSIIGNLDNKLYELHVNDAEIMEMLSQIEEITKEMSRSIDDFRGCFSKEKRTILLKNLLLDILKSKHLDLQECGIEIGFDAEEGEQFFGDEQLFKQVIITLLDNAKDAFISRNTYKPHIKISAKSDENFLIIDICDNAGGMSKSIRKRIFEPSFTTKHSSEGTGLGLYMAKKLLEEQMNATLSVSNFADGSCFKIKILKDQDGKN